MTYRLYLTLPTGEIHYSVPLTVARLYPVACQMLRLFTGNQYPGKRSIVAVFELRDAAERVIPIADVLP